MSTSNSFTPLISAHEKLFMSLHLHMGCPGHPRPALDLALDKGAELLGRVAHRLDAELFEALRRVGLAQELAEIGADPACEPARRAAGGDDAVDAEDVEPAKRFGDRGNFRRGRIALRARHRERLHLSRPRSEEHTSELQSRFG